MAGLPLPGLQNLNLKSPVVWIVAIGGGVVLYLLYRRFQQNNPVKQAQATGPNESGASQGSGPGVIIIEQSGGDDDDTDGMAPPPGTNPPPVRRPPPGQPVGGRVPVQPVPPARRPPPGRPVQPVGGRVPVQPVPPVPPSLGRRPPPVPGQTPPGPVPPSVNPYEGGVQQRVPPIPESGGVSQYVHPQAWPSATSTIYGIASTHGVTPARIMAFPENQYIAGRPGGWNMIYPSDTVRIA